MISPSLDKLRRSFDSGTTLPLPWRMQQLARLAELLTDESERFVAALRADLGKSAFETQTTEIGLVLAEIRFARRHLHRWVRPKRVRTPLITQLSRSCIVPEPKGVVLIIGAWNYPVQLLGVPLVAAIAAGNAAVLKPSELALATSRLWTELLPQYLDPACYSVVEGAAEVTGELLRGRFDHIFFTGGGRVARIVMTAAAEQLVPVTLELGGKSPCMVAADADIENAARRIAWGKFLNAGQSCVAPDYVLVERKVAAELMTAFKRQLDEFFGGDAAASPDYARIVNDAHFERLSALLDEQPSVYGGQRDRGSRYIAPTLVAEPQPAGGVMQEEIFGPILPVLAVDSMAAAIHYLRERPKPLALYVFTADRRLQNLVVKTLSAGNICINDTMMFMGAPTLPFGGIGASGMGRYHGRYGFETFSHMKSVMRRSLWPDPDWRYPPYSARKLRWLRKLQ